MIRWGATTSGERIASGIRGKFQGIGTAIVCPITPWLFPATNPNSRNPCAILYMQKKTPLALQRTKEKSRMAQPFHKLHHKFSNVFFYFLGIAGEKGEDACIAYYRCARRFTSYKGGGRY